MHTHTEKESKNSKKFKILVDKNKVDFNQAIITGRDILTKSGHTPPECHTLYQKLKGCDFEKVGLDESVDLSHPGIEKFTVKPPVVFHYTLDDEPETTDEKQLTANEILSNGGLSPITDYYLIEFDDSGQEIPHKDNPDEPIDMKCPGSKFVSVFRGETPVSFKPFGHGSN